MIRRKLAQAIDSPLAPAAAAIVSLALGLFFIFGWSPLPWGWEGIDHYHSRAIRLAHGQPFDTTDVPWGYAYFVASLYTLFGSHPWIPLLAQALLNALVPALLYRLVMPLAGRRVAALSALLVGAFSFNTVYASTQSSDSVSTVVFLAGLLAFARGVAGGSWAAFAWAGLAGGVAAQFRPNLILFPLLAAGLFVLARRFRRAAWIHAAAYLSVAGVVLLPWIVRNYRLTETFMPTSTHGGIQLWYGTLQTGPYLESRAYNPRSAFESAAFDYTSLANQPLIVTADYGSCRANVEGDVALEYWTDRDPTHRRVRPTSQEGAVLTFELPGQPDPTTLYYFFEARYPAEGDLAPVVTHPMEGVTEPYVAFVATDHLGDLDRHDDLLDLFDVVRLVQYLAWQVPPPTPSRLDFTRDGRLDDRDLTTVVVALVPELAKTGPPPIALRRGDRDAVIELPDGSSLNVPRDFSGRQTDVVPQGDAAFALVARWRSRASLAGPPRPMRPGECGLVEHVAVNGVFHRREVHMMGRYLALAFDNIGRDPEAFARASLYRMVRLFVIRGTTDEATTQQFDRSRLVYAAGSALSLTYFAVFLFGVWVALRRRSPVLWLLVPVAYVPLTIAVVLTNMRYTITVQPLMFVFVAMALVAALRLDPPGPEGGSGAAIRRAG